MENILLVLLFLSFIVNLLLLTSYLNLRRFLKNMNIEKYKNCIIQMLEVKSKFEEVSTQKIRDISEKISELEELSEVIDEKIMYYEELDK